MHNVKKIADDMYWVGGNEKNTKDLLFKRKGAPCNSYLILDDKTALFDSPELTLGKNFIENIKYVLRDRTLDYFFLNHMEPDYYENIVRLLKHYPEMKIVGNEQTFRLISRYYDLDIEGRTCVVGENDAVLLGKHIIEFCMAPMVH